MSRDVWDLGDEGRAEPLEVPAGEAAPSDPAAPVDVTVAIPCYDVEGTVRECVDSVLRNNRVALEVLCVNDGSRDGTLAVLESLAEGDARVRVVDKPNGGYGSAVNRGLSEARGTYVAVAEPDDYVAPHMYDDLFELARSFGDPDVVKSSYWRLIREEDGGERARHNEYYRAIRPPRQPFRIVDDPSLIRYHPSIWSALYRRAFLEGEGIRFREVPGAGWVDNPFSMEVLAKARTIVYTDDPYYHYREDLPGSSTVTLPWQTRFERWHEMLDVLETEGIDDAEVLEALYSVGFRHVERALAANPEGSPDYPHVLAAARGVFERMDPELVGRLDTVSPGLRRMAFLLRGERPRPMSRLAHARTLVERGLHSIRGNGLAFTWERIRRNARLLTGRIGSR